MKITGAVFSTSGPPDAKRKRRRKKHPHGNTMRVEPTFGFEPKTPRLQVTCSGQLSYVGIKPREFLEVEKLPEETSIVKQGVFKAVDIPEYCSN